MTGILSATLMQEANKVNAGTSFVQVEVEDNSSQVNNFNSKYQEFQDLNRQLSGTDSSPILLTLVEVATKSKFKDAQMTRKNNRNFEDFRKKKFASFKIIHDSSKQQMLRALKSQAKDKLDQIKAVGKILANGNSQMVESETIVRESKNDISHYKAEITRKQNELLFWKKLCTNENNMYAKAAKVKSEFTASLQDTQRVLLGLN